MKKHSTKLVLQQSLVDLVTTKPFEKVSVQELTEKAEINRQTFYYHYKGKNELLKEVYYKDCLHYLDQEISLENWEEQTLLMLKAMYKKPHFYLHTLDKEQEILLENFANLLELRFLDFFDLLDKDHILDEEDKHFYASFFADGCTGVLKRWLYSHFKEQPIVVAARLFRLAKDVEFFAMRLYDGYEG